MDPTYATSSTDSAQLQLTLGTGSAIMAQVWLIWHSMTSMAQVWLTLRSMANLAQVWLTLSMYVRPCPSMANRRIDSKDPAHDIDKYWRLCRTI
ncbi:hypothetical protein BHM03_00026105 [Ensete ventricosum]|nr:hypothetical protein BHM03_00026105 [Ensete ventricosum]